MHYPLALATVILSASCAAPMPPCPAHPPSAPASPSAPLEPVLPLATDLYLPTAQTGGSPYCLNPQSAKLRQLLSAPTHGATDPLDRRALAADIPIYAEMLRGVYSGYPELAQHRSFDVQAFFAQWQARLLSKPGTISFEEGIVMPLISIKSAVRDNHLMVKGWGLKMLRHPRMQVVEHMVDARLPNPERCQVIANGRVYRHTLRTAKRLNSEGKLVTVVALSTAADVSKSPQLLCPQPSSQPSTLRARSTLASRFDRSAPPIEYASLGDTAIITVRRLWGNAADKALLRQLADKYPEHRRHKRIVFDFRGNPGGNDGYIYQWIDKAKRGSWSSPPSIEIFGALAPCHIWNYRISDQIAHGEADTIAAEKERASLRAAWPRQLEGIRHGVHNGLVESKAESPYTGRVYVLVDRHSASSGESGPDALRAAMGAMLIGERTAGFLQYGNLKTFVLPHTGIRVMIPSKRNYFDPPAEGVGLPVDVYLDTQALLLPAEQLIPMIEAIERAEAP